MRRTSYTKASELKMWDNSYPCNGENDIISRIKVLIHINRSNRLFNVSVPITALVTSVS